MRELTAAEIERLDFSGEVPDLHVPAYSLIQMASTQDAPARNSRKPLTKRANKKHPLRRRVSA